MSFLEWIDAVRPGGVWDYKNNRNLIAALKKEGLYDPALLADFGNFHFGITSAARGNSLTYTLTGAGGAQVLHDLLRGKWPQGTFAVGTFLCAHSPWCNGDPFGYQSTDQIAMGLTSRGFGWLDNPSDSLRVMEGWRYQRDE